MSEALQADSGPATNGDLHADGRPLTFREFVCKVAPHFIWYRHNEELADVVDLIVDGKLKRVMIWVPPGTGKSETVSRLLSAYYIYRFPDREVGLVSYGADLAEDLSGDARDNFEECGGKIDTSTNAKKSWYTDQGGGMWARGFGGGIRGRRFHLGIVDDPHKGPEDLESEALREKVGKWWNRTWLNRQNRFFAEGAAIVVVMQRLHEADLCGFLLAQPDAAKWTVVALDAVRSEIPWQQVDDNGNDIGDVPSCVTMWPDWRKPGELLCPEILGWEQLKENQADADAYAAQFLQRPAPVSGQILKREWFAQRVHPSMVPLLLRKTLGVDLAVSTKATADKTAAFPLGYGVNGKYYLFSPYCERAEAPDAEDAIAAKARNERVNMVGVETVAFQLSFVQHLMRMPLLAGIAVVGVDADKDKQARARGWAPIARDGLLILVDDGSGWIEVFLKIAEKFPRVKHDDLIDAIGIAFAALRECSMSGGAMAGGQAVTGAVYR